MLTLTFVGGKNILMVLQVSLVLEINKFHFQYCIIIVFVAPTLPCFSSLTAAAKLMIAFSRRLCPAVAFVNFSSSVKFVLLLFSVRFTVANESSSPPLWEVQ